MAGSQVAVVYNTLTGNVEQIRTLFDDTELPLLDDASLNYPGCTKVKLLHADYDKLQGLPQNLTDIAAMIIPGSAVTTPVAIALGT